MIAWGLRTNQKRVANVYFPGYLAPQSYVPGCGGSCLRQSIASVVEPYISKSDAVYPGPSLAFLTFRGSQCCEIRKERDKLEKPMPAWSLPQLDDADSTEEYSFLQQNAIYLSFTRHVLSDPSPSTETLILAFFLTLNLAIANHPKTGKHFGPDPAEYLLHLNAARNVLDVISSRTPSLQHWSMVLQSSIAQRLGCLLQSVDNLLEHNRTATRVVTPD